MIILPAEKLRARRPATALLWAHPLHCLSLGLGTGLSPKAPGTVGTLLGYPLYLALQPLPLIQQWGWLLACFILGVSACGYTGRVLGVGDHPAIVWDEIVAMAAVLTVVPVHAGWWLLAFLLFRLFDIWKPFPISWVDARVKGGLGVMLDDALAAGMAIVILWCVQRSF